MSETRDREKILHAFRYFSNFYIAWERSKMKWLRALQKQYCKQNKKETMHSESWQQVITRAEVYIQANCKARPYVFGHLWMYPFS